jgi:hypothetical protein
MPSSIQTELDLTPPSERQPWRTVRETSIAQYVEGRAWLDTRARLALTALAGYYNRHQQWPTSAEAYQWTHPEYPAWSADFKLGVLNFRRAVSDLQRAGIVEANGPRPCRVSKLKKIETWRAIPAGRS